MNNLPQLVSTYMSDGPHLAQANQSHLNGDNSVCLDKNDTNRSRILRACEGCRRRKLKCDGNFPACRRCMKHRRECMFRPLETKEKRRKGAEYIKSLERRLVEMESLLKSSGLLQETEGMQTRESRLGCQNGRDGAPKPESVVLGPQVNPHLTLPKPNLMGHSSVSNLTSIMTPREMRKEVQPGREEGRGKDDIETLSDKMCSLMTNKHGEAKYIGSSSGYSVLPSDGIEGVDEIAGDTSVQEIMAAVVEDDKFHDLELQVLSELFQRRIYEQLPAKKECLELLELFFKDFNIVFPLFHRPTFLYLVERQYSSDPYAGSGWWASLNVVLAIAHRLRVRYTTTPEEDERKAWGYLKNSMGVLAELMVQNTDLLSVQALLGMALFMYCTSNPQPSFSLVAASIRLSHSIGLHKHGSAFNLKPIEIEQRSRVFWIAYILDKEICLRTGRPPAQDDNDMNVELPISDPEDGAGITVVADSKINVFRLMSQFATIQSKIFTQLYSADTAKQSVAQLLKSTEKLDNELEEWRAGIPIGFRPDEEHSVSHAPAPLLLVLLHLAYYNSVATIHRISEFWTRRLSDHSIQDLKSRLVNHRVFESSALVVAAARSSIDLLQYIPQADSACVWHILYYPITSLINLFSNILRDPQNANVQKDLHLMGSVVEFLTTARITEGNRSFKQMLDFCSELEKIAVAVHERSDQQVSSRKKSWDKICGNHTAILSRIPVLTTMPSSLSQQSPVARSPELTNQMNAGLDHIDPGPFNDTLESGDLIPESPTSEIYQDYTTWPENDISVLADMRRMNNGTDIDDLQRSIDFNTLQEPLLPQNMWLMPMPLEWDWEEFIDGSYRSMDFA